MEIKLKIEDYLSQEEIKQECKNALQSIIIQHFSKESQIERLISNLSHEFLFDEISKCIGEDSEKLVKETVIKLLKDPDTIKYNLFRRKDAWEYEESKAFRILQETIESCKELIKKRIVQEIEKYDFNTDEFRYKIQKTLEKLIEPKFKVGDIIQDIDFYKVKIDKVNIEDECYECGICNIGFNEQDDWKLVTNKFDLSTLKPYKSEVLYRNSPGGYWKPAFWGAYIPENSEQHSNHNFLTTDGFTRYCIPFEGNEHLMGKQDDCDDFYKTWED